MVLDEKDVFVAALALPEGEEREAYLQAACAGQPELLGRLRQLLSAHEASQGPLDRRPAALGVTEAAAHTEGPGTVIGPYKLLQQIGEGGMGTVWMAQQQEPVKRLVALKLIKAGMDSRQVIARFEAERQALALMDHPNIARVLDAGTTSAGRPYFVMDLVKGVPITRYCDEHRLTPRQRLELFLPVCQAVQHAHQKGIIHRDLKPTNVLVALYDGKPVPKVIDFGVAKAAGPSLTEKTLVTGFGNIVGTLEYMSPEQAEFNQLDIDTRSDIYSLGVLLYELLTGSPPFSRKELATVGLLEMLRVIREQEPSKPSTKLSTAEGLPTLAANRGTEPAKLTRLVRGELDWIVMKALEKDRNRRYDTANGFAMDVQRYLADEPVLACPPSAGYRLRKFLRRNTGPVVAAALVLLALIGGIVGTTWGMVRADRARQAESERAEGERLANLDAQKARQQEAQRAVTEAEARKRADSAERQAKDNEKRALVERDRAEEERRVAEAVVDFLRGLLAQANPHRQAETLLRDGGESGEPKHNPTIREVLDRAAVEVIPANSATLFPRRPLVQAQILKTIGIAYLGVGEYGRAIAHLERSRTLYVDHLGPDHLHTLSTLRFLALANRRAGKSREAIPLLEKLRDSYLSLLGPDDERTLATLNALAGAYRSLGRLPEAIAILEQIVDLGANMFGPDDPRTLVLMHSLGAAYREAGKLPEALRLLETVRDGLIATLGRHHPLTLHSLHSLAGAYAATGRLREAIQLGEQVRDEQTARLGPDHPDTLATLSGLAGAYEGAGKLVQAIQLFEHVRDKRITALGPDHPDTLATMASLASVYGAAGRLTEAMRLSEQVRDKLIGTFGPVHRHTLKNLNNLAVMYGLAGRLPKAIQLLEHVRDKRIATLGPDHPDTLFTLSNLASVYGAAGKLTDAIRLSEQVRDKRYAKLGGDHPETLHTLSQLGMQYQQAGRLSEAIESLTRVREKQTAKLGADHPDTLATLHHLAFAYRAGRKLDEALPLCEAAVTGRRARLGADHPYTLMSMELLARIYLETNRLEKALPLLKDFVAGERKLLGTDNPHFAGSLAWAGLELLKHGQEPLAETLLRECLAIREKTQPDVWSTFNAQSMLGAALLGQKKYVEAEPLLLQGYEGMKRREATIPTNSKVRLTWALERLVRLYDVWGKEGQAGNWRKKLEEHRNTEQK